MIREGTGKIRFTVTGAGKETGIDRVVTLEADNERDARELSGLMGILVESVSVAPAATPVADYAGPALKAQPAESPSHDAARKAARNLSGASIVCAIVGWLAFCSGLLVVVAGGVAPGIAAVMGAILWLILARLLEFLGSMGLVVCDIADHATATDRDSSRP